MADGTKKRIAYYSCGNWKNSGIAACNSNSIRCDKSNEYVFDKINQLLGNEKMIKSIVVNNINKERNNRVKIAKKELEGLIKNYKDWITRRRKFLKHMKTR